MQGLTIRAAQSSDSLATDASSPLSPNPAGNRTVKSEFREFFEKRDTEKKGFYQRVVFLAMVFMFPCGFGIGVGLSVAYSNSEFGSTVLMNAGMVLAVLATLGASLTVLVVSTVPTEEFDIDERLQASLTGRFPWLWRAFSYSIGLMGLVIAFGFTSQFPFVHGLPVAVGAVMFLLHDIIPRSENYSSGSTSWLDWPFTTKICFLANAVYIPVISIQVTLFGSAEDIGKNFLYPNLFLSWGQSVSRVPMYVVVLTYGGASLCYLVSLCVNIYLFFRLKKQAFLGWRTYYFYAMAFLWLTSGGVGCLFSNVSALYFADLFSTPVTIPGNLAIISAALIPAVTVAIVGPKNVFTLVARFFEFDLARLRNDGAQLAALVAKCSLVDSAHKFYWVHRSTECDRFKAAELQNPDLIKRSFWLYSELVGFQKDPVTSNVTLTLRVSMSVDMDDSWGASFKGQSVCFASRGESYATNPSPTTTRHTAEQFEAWKDANFRGKTTECNAELQTVTVTEELKGNEITAGDVQELRTRKELGDEMFRMCEKGLSESISKLTVKELLQVCREDSEDSVHGEMLKMKLLAFSKSHFRFFAWDKFDGDTTTIRKDLFGKSPRELKNEAEKLALYKLSDPKVIRHNGDKIDYFVSHSWEDNAAVKTPEMKTFMDNEKIATGKFPTLWLDKVCIDQSDPGNGIAVLPINVGACKRMLVLLSKSYLKRLWCVWELFSLFTFCYKELAHQRIVIVPLYGGTPESERSVPNLLKGFDLDKAHCFDPNEEFKLRNILGGIGIERLTACVAGFVEKNQPQVTAAFNLSDLLGAVQLVKRKEPTARGADEAAAAAAGEV